jgi:hypothetical protein
MGDCLALGDRVGMRMRLRPVGFVSGGRCGADNSQFPLYFEGIRPTNVAVARGIATTGVEACCAMYWLVITWHGMQRQPVSRRAAWLPTAMTRDDPQEQPVLVALDL